MPWLFPYGINGYNTDSTKRLTLGQYYKFRFCNRDSRWRKEITYLINSVNLFEKQYLSQLISMYTRVRKKSDHQNSRPLTANDVLNSTYPDFRENSYQELVPQDLIPSDDREAGRLLDKLNCFFLLDQELCC